MEIFCFGMFAGVILGLFLCLVFSIITDDKSNDDDDKR